MDLLWIVILLIAAAGVSILVAHRKLVVQRSWGAKSSNGDRSATCTQRLCGKCVSRQLLKVDTSPGFDARHAEATIRRKRQWLALRGEQFLRNVMFARRGLDLLEARCSVCSSVLPVAPASATPLLHRSDDTVEGCWGPLQAVLDGADAQLEQRELHALRSQRITVRVA